MIQYCPNCGKKIKQIGKFCGSCGHRQPDIELKQQVNKKQLVMQRNKRSRRNHIIISGYVLALAAFLVIYMLSIKTKEEKIIGAQPKVTSSVEYSSSRYDMKPVLGKVIDDKLIIPLNEVLEKKFIRFAFNSGGREIPLLAYLTEDGKIVTSISMCEPCNSTSFHISGNKLICNSCGTTWNLNSLESISGSCGKYPPDPIPSVISGNEIRISLNDILSWQKRA